MLEWSLSFWQRFVNLPDISIQVACQMAKAWWPLESLINSTSNKDHRNKTITKGNQLVLQKEKKKENRVKQETSQENQAQHQQQKQKKRIHKEAMKSK